MIQQQHGLSAKDKISALVETANRVPAIAWMLRGWDRSFVLSVDGEEVGIVTSGGQAKIMTKPQRSGSVWFGLTERTLEMLIVGRLSPLTAKLSGRLRSAGNVADILRFASIFTACLQQQRADYTPASTSLPSRLAPLVR